MSRRTGLWISAAFVIGAVGSVSTALGQAYTESLGDRIVRFHFSKVSAEKGPPSFSLLPVVKPTGSAPANLSVQPKLYSLDGDLSVQVDVPIGTSLYGTGEVSGPLIRNGRRTATWNTDAFGYSESSPTVFQSLYQSHPWVLAVRPDGTAFGVLADTTCRAFIDLSNGINIKAEGPLYPLIVIERDTPLQVVQALADLTGHIEMPPRWAIGYQQSRYSYTPDARVREIAAEFRKRRLPCDAIWLGIDSMNGYRCFTFDPKAFPDPRQLNADLHAQGFRSVWPIDPWIKAEQGYSVFDSGSAIGAWVQQKDGSVYRGEVWPGMCVFPDFTRKDTRTWWSGLFKDFVAAGVDGVCNDMNEPAVFNVQSRTMPDDNVHRPDAELGGLRAHAFFHNVYGRLMTEATREGVMAAEPNKRPFVLSRANFIGGQRFAATWTGDNTADWAHFEESVPMVLNLGLSAQPFAGPDIGGFAGNGPAGKEGELFARWMGVGTLLPFARGHTGKESINKEPWAFDQKVEGTCRQALERRYRLLPYFYTLFEEAHRLGSPIVRPTFFADPKDPALRSEDDAFLLGGDLLVVPQLVPDRSRAPAMPRGLWRPFGFDDTRNPDLPSLFLRGGAILPTGPVMQYTTEKPLDEITLLVCLDASGKAAGSLYEDSGDGWAFRDGEFRRSRFVAEKVGQKVTVRVDAVEGKMPRTDRKVAVRVLAGMMEVLGYGTEAQGVEIIVTDPVARPDHK